MIDYYIRMMMWAWDIIYTDSRGPRIVSNSTRILSKIHSQHGLRGIAALLVAIYHGRSIINDDIVNIDQYSGLISRQYLSVDLFFMMSGFILCHVYEKKFFDNLRGRLAEFWIARVARLFPLFYFTTAVYAIIFTLLNGIGIIDSRIIEENSTELFIYNLLLIHSWGIHDSLGWNFPSWSIRGTIRLTYHDRTSRHFGRQASAQ